MTMGSVATTTGGLKAKIGSIANPLASSPPPQFYDPGLDAQGNSAVKGYQQLLDDYGFADDGTPTGRVVVRNQDDYNRTLATIGTSLSNSLADLNLSGARSDEDINAGETQINTRGQQSLADILKARQREGQDYGTATDTVKRTFTNLGDAQAETGNAAGLVGSGFFEGAAGVRAANQGREQGGLDTTHGRAVEDSSTAEQRLKDAIATALAAAEQQRARVHADQAAAAARAQAAAGAAGGNASLGYNRGVEDAGVTTSRGGDALGDFLQSLAAAKWFQATQAGYTPTQASPSRAGRS